MRSQHDQDFRQNSQQYLKKKAERREAQQRFFEENLNEKEIFKTQLQRRKECESGQWMQTREAVPIKEEEQLPLEGTGKEGPGEIEEEGVNPKSEASELKINDESLEDILVAGHFEDEQRGLGNPEFQLVEPEIILGKIEGFLDVMLRCSLNNFKGKKKKRERFKGERKLSVNKRKKGKIRDKGAEIKGEAVKEETDVGETTRPDKPGDDILKIGELLRTTNS